MTYSIVARDSASGDFGVAVHSHFLAVGSVVPWARAGVGAVATQSIAEPEYGPKGLELMASGSTPTEALSSLLASDESRERRQVAMVGRDDKVAAYTGTRCIPHAGHAAAPGVSAQANLVESPECWEAMISGFDEAPGDLPQRLLAALVAADATGGDIRGRQSAAMLVVRGVPTGSLTRDVRVNLRVDDHPAPLDELARLVDHGRAMGSLLELLETPGLFDGPLDASHNVVQHALLTLDDAQQTVGRTNPEPTVWRALLLARAGDDAAAATALRAAADVEPRVLELMRRFASAGMWTRPADELEIILGDVTRRA